MLKADLFGKRLVTVLVYGRIKNLRLGVVRPTGAQDSNMVWKYMMKLYPRVGTMVVQ